MATEARIRANNKYARKTYDTITLQFRKDSGEKELFKDAADKQDLALTDFVRKALHYIIDNDIKLK